jgi:hypothetical protein
VFFGLNCRTEGLIADFFPAAARLGGILAAQYPFGGGQETEDDSRFLISETGFDDKSAELNFAPGIEPAIGINYPLHPNSIPQ